MSGSIQYNPCTRMMPDLSDDLACRVLPYLPLKEEELTR